ncbi:MAG: hypothetical protein GY810_23345 [Aureispira sp.]|nr:hypothetical protein [Aureispira sp.]
MDTNNTSFSIGQKFAAWCVHAFTASGIVVGFFAIVAITEGNIPLAFALLFATLIIDGIDGTFARMFRVQEVLPNMSGKMMDAVIDFATYAIIPAFLIYAAVDADGQYLIPDALRSWSAIIILLVSALYYGKDGMISSDYYFIGFPVMWNAVAFYIYYVFGLPPMLNFIAIIVFAILHFVPIKYLYPSRTKKFMKFNILNTILFVLGNVGLLIIVEGGYDAPTLLTVAKSLSILSVAYYGALSVYHTYFDPDTKDS